MIYSKLMQARMALHSKEIKKSGRNTFAGYNYMELADFLVPVQTIFHELGLCGIVSFTADTASLTIIDTEDGSQHVITSPMGSAALKGCHEVQNIGAVETYQRRYLWMAALEIVEHDAIDGSEPKKDDKRKPPVNQDGGGAISPRKLIFDGLQPDVQTAIRRAVPQVEAAMPNAEKATDVILMVAEEWTEHAELNDIKAGFAYLLLPATSAALKRHSMAQA